MRRDAQGVVLLLLSVVIFRLTLGGTYVYFVKEAMKPLLLASATVLLVLGAVCVWQVWRGEDEEGHDDGHGHLGLSRAAWLILLPILVGFIVTPRPLGSYTASRQLAAEPVVAEPAELLPLPAGDPVDLPLSEYLTRAGWGQGTTLQGRDVRLTGFVMPKPKGGWWLTRLGLSCCAADALSWRVEVVGARQPPVDSWVTVTGTWVATMDGQAPAIKAIDIVRIAEPENPYE